MALSAVEHKVGTARRDDGDIVEAERGQSGREHKGQAPPTAIFARVQPGPAASSHR